MKDSIRTKLETTRDRFEEIAGEIVEMVSKNKEVGSELKERVKSMVKENNHGQKIRDQST